MQNIGIQDFTIEFVERLPGFDYKDVRHLPDSPGLYFVCASVSDSHVVYIGETSSIYKRWLAHELKSLLNFLSRIGVCICVKFLEMDWDEKDRKLLEMVAIKKLNPSLNTAHNSKWIPGGAITQSTARTVFKGDKSEASVFLDKPLEILSKEELMTIASWLNLQVTSKIPISKLIDAIKNDLGDLYPHDPVEIPKDNYDSSVEKMKETLISYSPDGSVLGHLKTLTLRQLKPIASKLRIYRYSHMATEQIIQEILLALNA